MNNVMKYKPAKIMVRDTVQSSAFSPCSRQLAVGLEDGTAAIYDFQSNQRLSNYQSSIIYKASRVSCITFSPRGRYLSVGSDDGTATIHDMYNEPNSPITTILKDSAVRSIAYSPCGKFLAVGSWNDQATIHNLQGDPSIPISIIPQKYLQSVAYSPCGQYIAMGSWNGSASIYDLQGDPNIPVTTITKGNTVQIVAFSPCGRFIAVGSEDGSATIHDTQGDPLKIYTQIRKEAAVYTLAFSPCGTFLAVGSWDGTATIHHMQVDPETPVQSVSKENFITSVAFSSNGFFAVGSQDCQCSTQDMFENQNLEKLISSMNFQEDTFQTVNVDSTNLVALRSVDQEYITLINIDTLDIQEIYQNDFFESPLKLFKTFMSAIMIVSGNKLHIQTICGTLLESLDFNKRRKSINDNIHTLAELSIQATINYIGNTLNNQVIKTNDKSFEQTQYELQKKVNKSIIFEQLFTLNPEHFLKYIEIQEITNYNVVLEQIFTYNPEQFLKHIKIHDLILKKKYVIKRVITQVQEQGNYEMLMPINQNISQLLTDSFTRDIALEQIRTSKMNIIQQLSCCKDRVPLNTTMYGSNPKQLECYKDDEGSPCNLKRSSISSLITTDCIKILSKTNNIKIFQNKTVAGLIDLIWTQKFFKYQLIYQNIKLFQIMISLIVVVMQNEGILLPDYVNYLIHILLIVASCIQIGIEIKESQNMGSYYFDDAWNLNDILHTLSVLAMIILSHMLIQDSSILVLTKAVMILFGTIAVIKSLRGFSDTSHLIRTIIRNIMDFTSFVILMIIVITGMALAFQVMLADPENSDLTDYDNFPHAMKSTFDLLVMGSLNLGDIDKSKIPLLTQTQYFFGLVLTNIVMLNALIALLGDSWSSVQENRSAQFYQERCSIILEFMKFQTKEELEKLNQEYEQLQCIEPQTTTEENQQEIDIANQWEGSANSIKRDIIGQIDKKVQSLTQEIHNLKQENKDLKQNLKTTLEVIELNSNNYTSKNVSIQDI